MKEESRREMRRQSPAIVALPSSAYATPKTAAATPAAPDARQNFTTKKAPATARSFGASLTRFWQQKNAFAAALIRRELGWRDSLDSGVGYNL